MEKVAVVIPIYKAKPDRNEAISLRQTMMVLGKYPIVLVCPVGLDVSAYDKMYAEKRGAGCHLLRESFDKEYFNGIGGYNRLLLSECFYERFSSYEYMLICQPDAYVFRDDLEYWCSKGYDYIGAPLFGAMWNEFNYLKEGKVGNGGFSLRRVDAFLKYFNGKKHVIPWTEISKRINFKAKPYTRWLVWLLMAMGWNNSPKRVAGMYKWNEDGFWSCFLDGSNYEMTKPSVNVALDFAWERFPSNLFKHVGHLPFGCHAWQKYEYESFWQKYIFKK